jgi:hypothetical protein
MRTRRLSAIAVILVMTFIPGSFLFGQKNADGANLSVRQKVDLEFTNLVRNVQKSKSVQLKVGLSKKFLKTVNTIRLDNPTQLPDDEIYMNNLVGSLESLPMPDKFKMESCTQYKEKIYSLYDPRSGGKSHNPAVNHALQVLDGICTK